MSKYFSAEFLRAKNSALVWLPLLAVPLVLLTYNFSRLASPALDASGVLMWQAMYVTGMSAPLVAVFAASAEAREKTAREGGTTWLPIDVRRVRLARFIVVALSLAAFHLINFGGTYLITAAAHRAHEEKVLLLGLYCFLGSLGIAGLAAACARLTSLIATLVIFVGWQLVSIVPGVVEAPTWWMWPMAWPLRLVLPVIGVHPNATPLEPENPLLSESPWAAIGLCTVLAVAGVTASTLVRPIQWRVRTFTRQAENTQAAAALNSAYAHRKEASMWNVLRAFAHPILTPALVISMALSAVMLTVAALSYPASYTHGLFAFAILPMGSSLLAVFVWPALSEAWAITQTENPRSATAILLWLALCVATMSAVASAAGTLAGGDIFDELRRFLISCVVGWGLALLFLLVVTRFGTAPAVMGAVIMTIISATLGGDVLAQTPLWMAAVPAWGETATTASRIVVALTAGSSGTTVLGVCAHRALRRGVFS